MPRPSLQIQVPLGGLFRTTGGRDVIAQPPLGPESQVARAVGGLLEIPDSQRLLAGLAALFGGASQYAITGSTAIGLHRIYCGLQPHRSPADLDLVVSAEGWANLQEVNEATASTLGFHAIGTQRSGMTYRSSVEAAKTIAIDLIVAGKSPAGGGLENADSNHEGLNLVGTDVLLRNLALRKLASSPQSQKIELDTAALLEVSQHQQRGGSSSGGS